MRGGRGRRQGARNGRAPSNDAAAAASRELPSPARARGLRRAPRLAHRRIRSGRTRDEYRSKRVCRRPRASRSAVPEARCCSAAISARKAASSAASGWRACGALRRCVWRGSSAAKQRGLASPRSMGLGGRAPDARRLRQLVQRRPCPPAMSSSPPSQHARRGPAGSSPPSSTRRGQRLPKRRLPFRSPAPPCRGIAPAALPTALRRPGAAGLLAQPPHAASASSQRTAKLEQDERCPCAQVEACDRARPVARTRRSPRLRPRACARRAPERWRRSVRKWYPVAGHRGSAPRARERDTAFEVGDDSARDSPVQRLSSRWRSVHSLRRTHLPRHARSPRPPRQRRGLRRSDPERHRRGQEPHSARERVAAGASGRTSSAARAKAAAATARLRRPTRIGRALKLQRSIVRRAPSATRAAPSLVRRQNHRQARRRRRPEGGSRPGPPLRPATLGERAPGEAASR